MSWKFLLLRRVSEPTFLPQKRNTDFEIIKTPGEHVIVRREPSNPYDSNALRVENVQRAQIGHIPRTMASKLAKYMV